MVESVPPRVTNTSVGEIRGGKSWELRGSLNRALALASRGFDYDETMDVGGVLGGSLPVAAGGRLRIEFLPLVDGGRSWQRHQKNCRVTAFISGRDDLP
jgi:hypothetical protein